MNCYRTGAVVNGRTGAVAKGRTGVVLKGRTVVVLNGCVGCEFDQRSSVQYPCNALNCTSSAMRKASTQVVEVLELRREDLIL